MASLATDMKKLSVEDNEEMHLQKFKALNLKAKDPIKLHWDNTTADVSKQKVFDAKFTKLYTPTKTLGYRVGVSYANRGGKETIIIGDFIKRLANTEEVAKNNALRSNNELAKKKKIEEKKAKKASKAEAEKAELKSLKDAKNKGKATIEMFQYDDCEDDVWFVDKLPLIQAYCMEILHNEIFQDEDLKIAWQFTEQYYWNDYSTGDCFYFGFLNKYNPTKKTLLESIAKAGKMYGEVWDGDIYGYGTTKTTYDIYLGEQINVENPICKVSGEPIEDNDIVVVVSRLPPIMDQDEKGNCHLINFKKYPHMFKKNDSNWHGAGDQGDWVDCAISCNWKFQTFVKLKHLTTRSRTALLKRSAPIGYTNSNGGWSFISYNNQGDDDYPEDYCKTLGEKVKQLSEEKEDSDSDSLEDSSDELKAAPLRASPFRTQVSNDAPSRRKAPEPRKNRAEVVAKTENSELFDMIRGSKKLMTYIKKENKIVKSDYFELEGVTNPTDDDWIHVFLDRCRNNILFNTEYEKQKQWKTLLSNYDYDILNFLKKCYMEFYPEDAKKEVEEEAKKAEQRKKDQEEFEKEWELKAAPLRASLRRTEVEKVDYNQENWLLRKIPEVKEFLKKELLSYKPSNMPYFSFIKHRYPHWDEHLFFYKIGLKYHEGRRRVVKFFKDNIWDRNRLKKERERIVPEIDEYNFYFESIQKENDRIIYDISAGRDFINDFDVDDGRIYKCDLSNEPLTEEDVVLVVSYSPPFTFTPNSKYCHLHPGIEHDDEEKSFPKVYVKDKNDVVGGNIQTMMECALASMEEFRFYIKLKYITEESKKKLLAEKVPVGRVSPLSLHQWVITDYTVKKKEKHYIKFNEDDYRFVPKRIKTLAQKLEWINTFNERYFKSLEEMKKGEAKGLSYVKKFGIWVEFKDMCRCEFCPIDNPC